MRIEFELDRADFAAFAEAVWQRRVAAGPSRRRWALLGVLALIAVLLGALLTLLRGDVGWLSDPIMKLLLWAIAVVLGMLLVVTALMALLRRFLVGRPPRDPAMLGWRAIELTDDGVVETTSSGSELTRWVGICEVRETEAQIHLCLSSASAHVVPKRAFASAGDIARFVERARFLSGAGHEAPKSSGLGWSKPAP